MSTPDHFYWTTGRMCATGSVPAAAGGFELPGAFVTEEVVAREQVVDTQAIGAGVALADVTLEQTLVVDEGRSLAVRQAAFGRRLPAGLAKAGGFHATALLPPPRAKAAARREPDHGRLPLNIAWPIARGAGETGSRSGAIMTIDRRFHGTVDGAP